MVTSLPSFAVVIPMFNEETGAQRCIEAVCAQLAKLPNRCKLIVVEDGGSDKTRQILENIGPSYQNLEIIYHKENKGYGRALMTGAASAAAGGFDYVLFMDSDLTNDPADIPKFVAEMAHQVDVIKATRYSDGGGVQGVPWYRVLISRIGNSVASALFHLPLSDCTNGFRAVKLNLLQQISLKENGFSLIMEELYRLKPLAKSYGRVPVTLTSRAGNLRATSFRYRLSVFWDYLKYPLRSCLGI